MGANEGSCRHTTNVTTPFQTHLVTESSEPYIDKKASPHRQQICCSGYASQVKLCICCHLNTVTMLHAVQQQQLLCRLKNDSRSDAANVHTSILYTSLKWMTLRVFPIAQKGTGGHLHKACWRQMLDHTARQTIAAFPVHVAVLTFLLHVNVALRLEGCWAGTKLTTRYTVLVSLV